MADISHTPTAHGPSTTPRNALRWFGIIFALAFPAAITWLYFDFAEDYSGGIQRVVYLTVKVIQFAFPAVWTVLALREPLRTAHPTRSGLLLGTAFSLAVVAAGMALFAFALRDLPAFSAAPKLIHSKIAAYGIDSPAKFFLLTGFYSLVHSLLEEYYWRWFVFRELRQVVPFWPAAIISSIGFTLHHVIVLAVFFGSAAWLVALLTISIAIGGVFWAWLFNRSNSVFDTWPSHLIIDVGIFLGVGYPLVRHLFNVGG